MAPKKTVTRPKKKPDPYGNYMRMYAIHTLAWAIAGIPTDLCELYAPAKDGEPAVFQVAVRTHASPPMLLAHTNASTREKAYADIYRQLKEKAEQRLEALTRALGDGG